MCHVIFNIVGLYDMIFHTMNLLVGIIREIAEKEVGGSAALDRVIARGDAKAVQHNGREFILFPKISFGRKEEVGTKARASRSKEMSTEAFKTLDKMLQSYGWGFDETPKQLAIEANDGTLPEELQTRMYKVNNNFKTELKKLEKTLNEFDKIKDAADRTISTKCEECAKEVAKLLVKATKVFSDFDIKTRTRRGQDGQKIGGAVAASSMTEVIKLMTDCHESYKMLKALLPDKAEEAKGNKRNSKPLKGKKSMKSMKAMKAALKDEDSDDDATSD